MEWINEYEKSMFYSRNQKESIKAAANIKDYHMPEILYKYRDAENSNHVDAC